MIKGAFQSEAITLVDIYVPNTGAPKYGKHILMAIKGESDSNRVRGGDFNTLLKSMDRSSRLKIKN